VIVRDIRTDFVADTADLDALAAALNAGKAPAFVAGSGVDRDDAVAELLELAERLQAPVFASALASRCSFPEDHPLFAGALPRIRSGVVQSLRPYDLVVVLGAPAFNYHVYSSGDFVPPGTRLFQLTDDPAAAAASGAGTAIITSLRPALRHLLRDVRPATRRSAPPRLAPATPKSERISIDLLLATLCDTLPADAIIVEEAPSTHTVLHDFGLLKPGAYFSAASGSLGYGLPAAVGAALAAPGRRIIGLIGDGSSYYGIQGLWTAAQHQLPITFVIVNNAGYGAMKQFTQHLKLTATPSFDIAADIEAIAAGFGCAVRHVDDPHMLAEALRESMTGSGPVVLNVVVDAGLPQLY
jgi:benzoylformate decarboxylase